MSVSQKMSRTLVLCVLLSLFQTVYSVEYWMSMYLGSDSNNGTSITSPWKTFGRLNGVMSTLKSGDKVHFCQGDRWSYSMISAVTAGVTYDAYNCRPGVTSRPQITPAVDLNYQRWSVSPNNSNVLVYDLSTDPTGLANGFRALWVNNIRYQLARWPNLIDPAITYGQVGEFVAMSGIQDTILTSPALQGFATNFWAGAHLTWRHANWIYFDCYVRSSTSAGVLQLDSTWGTQPNFNFYMEANYNGRYSNHVQLLDQIGEWVLDVASKSIYLIPLNNATRDGILDGSIPVTALYPTVAAAGVFQKATTITGIEFTQGIGGVTVMSSSVTFTNNAITHVLERGFYVPSYQSNVLFQNNVVDDCESTCVQTMGATSHVLYNTISRCGLYPRSTPSNTNGAWNGVTVTGGTVRGNTITGCGYSCVSPHSGSTVDANILTDSMLTLNDGGAVYSFGTSDNYAVVTNNVIRNVVGNVVSYFGNPLAPCIYMDENTYGAQIRNNSCTTAPSCVMFNKAYSHTFMMNECQSPGIYINQGGNHLVAGNLMVSRGTNGAWQNPLFRMYDTVNANYNSDFTVYDQAYCTLGPGYQFQRQTKDGTWRYDKFSDWKEAELLFNGNFERGSMGVTSCSGWKPIDVFSTNPWGFLSSSTGASSSAVSSSAVSSSRFSSSAVSSSAVSSSTFSSSAVSSSVVSSSAVSSSAPSSTVESSSIAPSSTAESSSAVSSTAESSSAVESSSVEPSSSGESSSAAQSSTAESSTAQLSSTAESSSAEPSSTAEPSGASSSTAEPQGQSSSSSVEPIPLGRCAFSGPFSQPTSTMTFTLTIDTVDIFTGERLMQDMSAWYAANQSISNLYDPSAVFPRGLQCGNLRPVSTTARRLLSSLYGTTLMSSSYVLTTYIVNVPQAAQLASVFTESVNEVGFSGPLSGSQVETGAAQVVQNCDDGLPVPVGGQCPEIVQSSTADVVVPSSTASDYSSSAMSSSVDFSSSVESSTAVSSSADFSSSIESSTAQSSSADSSSVESSSAESSSAQSSSAESMESSSFTSSAAESSTAEPSSTASSSSVVESSSVAESSSAFESSSIVSSTGDIEISSTGLESSSAPMSSSVSESSTGLESSSASMSSSVSESSTVVEPSSASDVSSTGAESSSTFVESSSVSESSSTDIAVSSTADAVSSSVVSSSAAVVESSSAVPSSSASEASTGSLSSSATSAQGSSTASVSSSEVPADISSSVESNSVSQSSTGVESSTGTDALSSTSCGEGCLIPDSDESSHSSSSSSAEVGGAVGGVIGAIVLLVVAGFAVRYFRSSRSSSPSSGLYPWSSPSNNASSSPSWSPDFNALKSSPSMSPGPNHEQGLALASFNLQDSPDMSPRSSGFLRESPVAGSASAHDLNEGHHDHPKFSFTLSEAESNQPPSPFPIHGSYSPSQSNAPFLGAPISPIGPQSSNSWSPSQSCAQYQAMPPSPIGTSSQLQPPMSPVSPIVPGNKQTAPKTEYFRMPSTTFKLPSKGRLGFLSRNQPPAIPTFTTEPRITTLTVTPPAISKVIPPPLPVTTSGGRLPPPIPTSQPKQ